MIVLFVQVKVQMCSPSHLVNVEDEEKLVNIKLLSELFEQNFYRIKAPTLTNEQLVQQHVSWSFMLELAIIFIRQIYSNNLLLYLILCNMSNTFFTLSTLLYVMYSIVSFVDFSLLSYIFRSHHVQFRSNFMYHKLA